MPRSRKDVSLTNHTLDQFNCANRGLGGDPSISTARPVMSKLSKKERAAIDKATQQAEIRRAKARQRMAIRRAKIKALPTEEQQEYQDKAQQARAKWREGNRRYLAIASWAYRNRKYVEMCETYGDWTRYDDYLLHSNLRKFRHIGAERALQRQQAAEAEADPGEESDLPDSSEIATSDSE
ncbi:hypothetical protein B0H13DRAFT_2366055 [Mycena leptocephala]|nr:hypothetical protein B0H13DRAFT_2366055 [Mycena leptocephala]